MSLLNNYFNLYNNKTEQHLIEDLICEWECEHEWVDDLIDIDPDTSKHICYCAKCEVTKS